MSRHKVDITGVNTANIKVLSNEEQKELFIKLKNGDLSAKEELINGNMKLVLSILKKYKTRVDNLDDLFQVGCIGLIKAIDNFDLSYDVKFSTYSVPMILGEVKRYIRDTNNPIRVARSVKDLSYKIMNTRENLINKLNKEPSTKEIADALNVSEWDVCNAIEAMRDTVSMYEPIYNDGSDTIYLYDQLEDNKNELYDIETKMSLNDALNKLKEKERYIINERFIVGKTQVELAKEIGISQAQISRLEKSGLDNIKKMII